MILRPTDEELKEFYLCGVRMGVTKSEAMKAAKNSDDVASYDCVYCASWHYIPANISETQLLDDAMTRYEAHVDEILNRSSASLAAV